MYWFCVHLYMLLTATANSRSTGADITFPRRPTVHDLIYLSLEEKSSGVNLCVQGSEKPFHNEVRVVPCALCVYV